MWTKITLDVFLIFLWLDTYVRLNCDKSVAVYPIKQGSATFLALRTDAGERMVPHECRASTCAAPFAWAAGMLTCHKWSMHTLSSCLHKWAYAHMHAPNTSTAWFQKAQGREWAAVWGLGTPVIKHPDYKGDRGNDVNIIRHWDISILQHHFRQLQFVALLYFQSAKYCKNFSSKHRAFVLSL